jgi:hypothetical protein
MLALFSAFVRWLRLSRVRALKQAERLNVHVQFGYPVNLFNRPRKIFPRPIAADAGSLFFCDLPSIEQITSVSMAIDTPPERGVPNWRASILDVKQWRRLHFSSAFAHAFESASARARRQGTGVLEPREKRQQTSWLKWRYV